MAKSRTSLFSDFKVEERIAPSSFLDVRYYPLAPSIVEFDPVGNREDDPPPPLILSTREISSSTSSQIQRSAMPYSASHRYSWKA